ncbi:uncharacterized protein FOMMEDRAFT_148416 [Fomitiporia mediterranea MF3/22]|uniref:uncharacterized protein n=1 Tax=Fomitiporia mediterranea (strain MF3/22) TaxID=694068 RepID=UPI00044075AD|nr:uncharacterized protein FOMMEDRAFT_148416 [Fomitiporia mediterranea MF3/22]EJD00071.1 hypothetical protein FOMMEDRAFT_148416 [Fomitiporia mediterranea MF3/22]
MPSPQESSDLTDSELQRVRLREIELKRLAGEVSCAECRRLKLKCDKKVPCSSCIRRECTELCPTRTSRDGISSGRQIAAGIVSSSAAHEYDVQRKLMLMSERIRSLEDALQTQNGASHPLLSAELLAIKQGVDMDRLRPERVTDGDVEQELVDAIGTLSVSEGRTMRYLGASATVDALLMHMLDSSSGAHSAHQPFSLSNLPPDLVQASSMWPFVPAYLSRPEHVRQLVSHLPLFERAKSLMEVYFANLTWFNTEVPVDRGQIVEEIFPTFYPQQCHVSVDRVNDENLHDLALLFVILACGAATDLTQPAVNPEAEKFYHLSRAALGMRSILEHGTFVACQALIIMAIYESKSGRKTSQESSYKLMSIGMLLTSSIGLHRDPSRWKLDSKTANRRRRTFWEINAIDKLWSLSSGRPAFFTNDAIDCEFPLDHGAAIDDNGAVIESVWQWRYRFTRDVLGVLSQKLCSSRPPKYTDIMEMDKLVRDFEIHPYFPSPPQSRRTFATDGEYRNLTPYVTWGWKEVATLYVHRNSFARAMIEYPSSPMRSPYATSFLATYRASTSLLQLLYASSYNIPLILDRMWTLWSISYSCAVIVGSVASRPSAIDFAAAALDELNSAIGIFETVGNQPIARNGLKTLYRLRDRAIVAFQELNPHSRCATTDTTSLMNRGSGRQASHSPRSSVETGEGEEELHILRGTTRYVEQRRITPNETLQHQEVRSPLNRSRSPTVGTTAAAAVFPASRERDASSLPQFSVEDPHDVWCIGDDTGASYTAGRFSHAEAQAFDYDFNSVGLSQSSFTHEQLPQAMTIVDDLYYNVDDANAEAWDAFLRQFELTNNGNTEREDREQRNSPPN